MKKAIIFVLLCLIPIILTAEPTLIEVTPYLMQEDHPIKGQLDTFFSKGRVTSSVETMIKGGFQSPFPRRATGVVVTKHPDFPNYIFKIYLDESPFYKDMPEHYCWILRIRGAERLRKVIQDNKLNHQFKVPQKWIYALPENPRPELNQSAKHFILIEENMNIYPDAENEKIWGSPVMTKELLTASYKILEQVGLCDAKPANLPFSRDGRIAFIDTQSWKEWPVKYQKITPFLSIKMQEYWSQITNCVRNLNPEASIPTQVETLCSELKAFDWSREDLESESVRKHFLITINQLKGSVFNKIKKMKAQSENYQKNGSESEDEFEQNYWKKKIISTEKKLCKYNKILTDLNLLPLSSF